MRRMVSVLTVVALMAALVAASAAPAFAGEHQTKKGSLLGFIDSESNFFIDQEGNFFIDSESTL